MIGDTVNGTRWNLYGKSVRSQTYTMNIISDNVWPKAFGKFLVKFLGDLVPDQPFLIHSNTLFSLIGCRYWVRQKCLHFHMQMSKKCAYSCKLNIHEVTYIYLTNTLQVLESSQPIQSAPQLYFFKFFIHWFCMKSKSDKCVYYMSKK